MKNPLKILTLLVALGLVSTSSGQAQILGSLYYSGTTSAADAQDFIDAGVTGISSSDAVTGFDISGSAPYSSGGITLTPSSNANAWADIDSSSNGPIYQSGLYAGDGNAETLTLSGLSGELEANQTYHLYLFGSSLFFTSQTNGQTLTVSYAFDTTQSGSTDLVGHGDGEYTLTTGSAIPDTLDLSVVSSGTNPSSYPAISAFALVGPTVPEPSTYALMLGGLVAVLAFVRLRRTV